jgi:excisionase family DNA binding protein
MADTGKIDTALLDISGVAARLGVSVRHVRRLVFERRIPYIKWGGHLRFDPVEINDWIGRNRHPELPTHR